LLRARAADNDRHVAFTCGSRQPASTHELPAVIAARLMAYSAIRLDVRSQCLFALGLGHLPHQSVSQAGRQAINRAANQSVNRSVNRSADEPARHLALGLRHKWCASVRRSTWRSVR